MGVGGRLCNRDSASKTIVDTYVLDFSANLNRTNREGVQGSVRTCIYIYIQKTSCVVCLVIFIWSTMSQ